MHESKFQRFMSWARQSESQPVANCVSYFQSLSKPPEFAVELVQQINYGPVETRRYFIPTANGLSASDCEFLEVTDQDLITGNFQKLNTLVCT
ncbi:uncharacterized protein N7483_002493 [Penicillium malachiteum]|uniref:uncharacterized protein n=1 Tax=Penicillium malachiteum TaxID=1324776 RepID=UPI002549538F|nr:uncharacterized protein N7483_002493 [Penicillium malachiteum]KAJ5737368.1 hypothetical protein N7483_002493 [Penicillium malachiteum]